MTLFDGNDWTKTIQQYDWYLQVPKLLDDLSDLKKNNQNQYEIEKSKMLDFFIESLRNDKVFLGRSGKDWDAQRKPIDTIIIHHTGSDSGMSVEKLSALELIRLYAPAYANPSNKDDKDINHKPVYSNHFNDGKMVFWPYHWIIRKDGTAERLLPDSKVGWQAGNWDVNCRSIAIVLDNDYENGSPSKVEIISIANVIVSNYSGVLIDRILGHREVNPHTVCPSNNFLGETGWKKDLLREVKRIR